MNIKKFFKNSFFDKTPLVAVSGTETFFLVCDTCNQLDAPFKIYDDSMIQT